MADGGQTIDQSEVIERAARRLARALGTGYGWNPSMQEARVGVPGREVLDESCVLAISRRGQVTEQAARSIGGSLHVRRQQRWSTSRGVVAIPSYHHDSDALAALSFARLDGPLEAILLLYATGDVLRYWPTVKLFGLASKPSRFADEALTDAMQRILCGRAAVSQDNRARELGVRAESYRRSTKSYEERLFVWLVEAAKRYCCALSN
ncbi:hypothetical protein SAMN04487785_105191 [Dyella jiangningensis]|nr:hypothetical protein BDW41_106128 [Dyella sp. AtDHG13]SDK10262.1 hypothetical protein SAMN04487785_105191 [Dyella jiangningensis]